MELFYSKSVTAGLVELDATESQHCVKVMRHRVGDEICVIDGSGTLMRCKLMQADAKAAQAELISSESGFGAHPYHLTMAVCPTKNIDRFEWFSEKATEIGVDVIVPVIGDHSERKIIKNERVERIVLSAAKQSLKGVVPRILEARSVKNFILECKAECKLICYCADDVEQRVSMREQLESYLDVRKSSGDTSGLALGRSELPQIAVLIGPEGDFSQEEVSLALQNGWKAVALGDSRLRTETAALVATTAVYLSCK